MSVPAIATGRPVRIPDNAADVLRNPPSPEPALLGSSLGVVVPGGITTIAGPTKCGKTAFELALVRAMTEGESLFGIFDVPKPLSVLMLQLELSKAVMTKRLQILEDKLAWTSAGLERFDFWCGRTLHLDERQAADDVVATIEQCYHYPQVVVLDSYNKAIGGNPDSTEQARRVMSVIREVQERTGAAFILTTELRKPPPGQRASTFNENEQKGNNDVAYDADSLLALQPTDATKRRLRLRFLGMRHAEVEPPEDLILVRTGLVFELLAEQVSEQAQAAGEDVAEVVRAYLERTESPSIRGARKAVREAGLKVGNAAIDAVFHSTNGGLF